MKVMLITFLSLISFNIFGIPSPITSIVDLMRETPAYINGTFTAVAPVNLIRDTSGYIPRTMELKARPVNFYFDEHSLNLETRGALYFWLGGIKCKINRISYDNRTGKFDVSADTPLGLFDKTLEGKIKTAVAQMYTLKLRTAFSELRQIRRLKSVNQASESIQAIIKALSNEGSGPHLPTITGDINLNFDVAANRRIMLSENYSANIKGGDRIKISGDFSVTNRRTTFNTMELTSQEAIIIKPRTNIPEIKSIELRQLKIDRRGMTINYVVGAEKTIQGLILTLNLVTSANHGRAPSVADCPREIEIQGIRRKIDAAFLRELSRLLRANRRALINAGVNPRLIDALD